MAEKTTTKKTTTGREKAPTAAKRTIAAEKKTTATKRTTAAGEAKATAPKTAAARTTKTARPTPVKRARPVRRAAAPEAATAGEHSWRRSRRRTRVGVVTSAKQAHTVTVVVERLREHPLYKKVIRVRKKFAAHDAAGDVLAGDLVRIQESRPFSATKRWQVVEVLSRIGEAGAAAPRVAEIERLLEATEGSAEQLARQAIEAAGDEDERRPQGGPDEQ